MNTRRLLSTLAVAFLIAIPALPLARSSHAQTVPGVRLAQEREDDEEQTEQEDRVPTPQVVVPETTTPTPSQTSTNSTTPTSLTNTNTVTTPAVTSTDTLDESGQSTDAEPTPIISTEFPWAWIITRAAGITSYILLGLLSLTGMLLTTGSFFRAFEPATAWSIHRGIASALLFAVLTHVGSLLFDHFINLRILDVLIPFVSPFQPLLVALGILGFYLLLLVLATSLYTMNRWPRFWRIVHYFSFVMFMSIFFHSLLIGTDMKTWWLRLITWGTMIMVVGLGGYRLWWKHHQPT